MKVFSLRDHLSTQGVMTEEGMKYHLSFIQKTLSSNPGMNVRTYRVDPTNPEGATYQG